jgi:hypothetical protein
LKTWRHNEDLVGIPLQVKMLKICSGEKGIIASSEQNEGKKNFDHKLCYTFIIRSQMDPKCQTSLFKIKMNGIMRKFRELEFSLLTAKLEILS